MLNLKITNWLKNEKKNNRLNVNIIKLSNLVNWNFNKKEITHKSGKFFKIVGLKVYTNFFKKNWEQPIIIQKEVGILGIIKNRDKYLLQAKVEPGNKNKIQISPTVQATKSNYNKVHKGKKVPYLEYFLRTNKKNIINQSEQGFRYLNKFNSNIIIQIKKKINLLPGFYWFSRNELEFLIKKKGLLNMNAISIFSSFIKKSKFDKPYNSDAMIKNFFFKNDKKFFIKSKIIPLSKINNWIYTKKNILHKNGKYFSVIGVKVSANKREVGQWCQPLIRSKKLAMAGFLLKKINNTTHYLCRYILKPGLKNSTITCTVNTSDFATYKTNLDIPNEQKKIISKYFFNKKKNVNKTIYDNIISDEGGRFYHCEVRNIAIMLEKKHDNKFPNNYIWVSQNQMINYIKNKKVDIEGRLLFGCININKVV
jgi:dTDP-4-dehydro-6-deoxy-alpha-D-glucopyranose 2,3-dehydratase